MFFKNKEKTEFEKTLPTDRLQILFGNKVLEHLKSPNATYVKSKRTIRFKKDLFHFEVTWDQWRTNTRQNDTRFQIRCSLYSSPYRKWEKTFYKLPTSLITTPIGGLPFHRVPGFDDTEFLHQGYSLTFKNRERVAAIIAKNIDTHISYFFSAFENWDDTAISMLETNKSYTFTERVPLTITDFLVLQDRIDEAWAYLDTNDQWYKNYIEQEKNGGEGLNQIWGPPYYRRKEKLAELLESDS